MGRGRGVPAAASAAAKSSRVELPGGVPSGGLRVKNDSAMPTSDAQEMSR